MRLVNIALLATALIQQGTAATLPSHNRYQLSFAPRDDTAAASTAGLGATDKGGGGGGGGGGGAGAAAAAAGGTASISTITGQITTIQKTINQTTDVVRNFQGGVKGLIGLLKLNENIVALGNNVKVATKSAAALGQLNSADSITLAQAFLPVQPQISTLVKVAVQKRPVLDGAAFKLLDVRGLIHDDLVVQAKGAGTLADTLIKSLDPDIQPAAKSVAADIQSNFSAAVTGFSGRAGLIKIPAKAVPGLSGLLNGLSKALGIKPNRRLVRAVGPVPEVVDMMIDPEAAVVSLAQDPDYQSLAAADTPAMDAAVARYMSTISDERIARLGPDENDVAGVPPVVLAVLKQYGVL